MNKCMASAFQSAEVIHGLEFLRNAYCSEQIGAAHKAVINAELNKAIDFVMHVNDEFCQAVQQEEQQHTRSNG